MRWLCLHFPWLALELHGLPPEQPQALLDSRQRILLGNPAAQAGGVKPGQALATALALCPELALLATAEAHQQAELTRLALWAGAFSARISLLPPQALLLEIASMLHYFGGIDALLEQVRQALEQTGYQARLVLGPSALGCELLAAVESWTDPDPARWQARLAQMEIDQLQLPVRQVEQLQGVGLRTLGDLMRLAGQSRRELARRFGPALLNRLDLLQERSASLPPIFTPPETFAQRVELAAEVTHSQGLLFPLRRLLAALEGFLNQRQQQACRLRLLLHQRDGQQALQVEHATGTASASHWLELCRLQFERIPLQAPVLELTLTVDELLARTVVSQDLFAPARAALTPAELLSRLQSRLGPAAISGLGIRADHRPERALNLTAPTERGPTERDLKARDAQAGDVPRPDLARPGLARPGWLLIRPQRLGRAQRAGLTWLSGPERICAGWWDRLPDERSEHSPADFGQTPPSATQPGSTVQNPTEPAVPPLPDQRDYFVARWPDGRCGWLYRDSLGHWFLQGWFG